MKSRLNFDSPIIPHHRPNVNSGVASMAEGFGQNVDPTAAIRAILGSYPFSIGLLRELLQNSDDARATEQVFVLDHRQHGLSSLYDQRLQSTQGPAFLAYNNALFVDEDWRALQNIHRSSKKADTSKIGKYGIGFRSCFHVTDNPQILSGSSLAILDPLSSFSDEGGAKFDYVAAPGQYHDQLSCFDMFLAQQHNNISFHGSVIRLPLRTTGSEISNKVVQPHEIAQLFHDFVSEEIGISMLFLKHISSIELYEIDVHGTRRQLALSKIERSTFDILANRITHTSVVTNTQAGLAEKKKVWRIINETFSEEEAIAELTRRVGSNPDKTLEKNKLVPEVGIALPHNVLTDKEDSGRLFTYLPLPLKTGFPAHVHSLFALTQSRQNLRNEDTGIVKGSDDKVFVEWNRLLFDTYIPQAWKTLLEVVTQTNKLGNIFHAWPPAQPRTLAGDSAQWQSFPLDLVCYVVTSPVWPLQSTPGQVEAVFGVLEDSEVVVAGSDVPDTVLRPLSLVGIKITRPPRYITNLLRQASVSCTHLTPSVAHSLLRGEESITSLQLLDQEDIAAILEYLVSTEDIKNVGGLPLFQLSNEAGMRISLVLRHLTEKMYTLLERDEYEVFDLCDEQAIYLHLLPPKVSTILRNKGPSVLNVNKLDSKRIVQYLELYPNRLNLNLSLAHIDVATVNWLSNFWSWVQTWREREQFYTAFQHLYLLPSRTGLRKADRPIFETVGIHPILLRNLEHLGVCFINSQLTAPARTVLKSSSVGLLRHINDVAILLQCIHSPVTATLESHESARLLAAHIAHHLPLPIPLPLRTKLRSLPIFPVLSVQPKHPFEVNKSWAPVPEGVTVKGTRTTEILPITQNIVFLDVSSNGINASILPFLDDASGSTLNDVEIVSLALEDFTKQPLHVQAQFVHYILRHTNSIPPRIVSKLKSLPFIAATDGSIHSPSDLLDTDSLVAILFGEQSSQIPRTGNQVEQSMIRDIQSLGLFQKDLTNDILLDRMKFASFSNSMDMAKRLLSIMIKSSFDWSRFSIPSDLAWMPTKNGLKTLTQCRDEESRPELFDEVLFMPDTDRCIPRRLREAFGWDQSLSLTVLTEQLSRTLDQASKVFAQPHLFYGKVWEIIREIGMRQLNPSDIRHLRSVTLNRPWVPVSNGQLVSISSAVLMPGMESAGFFEVSFDIRRYQQVRSFLKCMGCVEQPSFDAIQLRLQELTNQTPTNDTVRKALRLLKLLPEDMDDSQRNLLLIPDDAGHLRSFSRVFYNDLGNRGSLMGLSNVFLAHHSLSENIAKKLHLERLGLRLLPSQNRDLDMGEKPITTIRNTLRQYSVEQFLPEFLANAADAKAEFFSILLDEFSAPTEKILSPVLAQFQTSPSLIIHNNKPFTAKDFEGICKTGIGGKEKSRGTIGQFGLGVLTMFHVTELAMLISADSVLFMDPSKDRLPIADRVSFKCSLADVRNLFPDHLKSVDGLFGFQADATEHYNATLFRLPLRTSEQTEQKHCIFPDVWRVDRVLKEIIEPFKSMASKCLLFTDIQSISFSHRTSSGEQLQSWSVEAKREDIHSADDRHFSTARIVSHQDGIVMEEKWRTVTMSAMDARSEERVLALSKKHRLRIPLIAGLAAVLPTPKSPKKKTNKLDCTFFSTLPLPLSTALPLHISASFALSADRRQIRLDSSESEESQYNRWILSEFIPPLYFSLLEDRARVGDNQCFWPGFKTISGSTSNHDPLSQVVLKSFYEQLGATDSQVFYGTYGGQPLTPSEAVLTGDEPLPITKVLRLLRSQRVVELPYSIRGRAISEAKLFSVCHKYVREEVLRDPSTITSNAEITLIQDVIEYLLPTSPSDIKKKDSTYLCDLSLLPLVDGTFGKFENIGRCTRKYYVWPGSSGESVPFRGYHLVNLKFQARKIGLLDAGLNVVALDPAAVKNLVAEHLDAAPMRSGTPAQEQEWISMFWKAYHHLPKGTKDFIIHFPLVPTLKLGTYISIDQCQQQSVILVSNSSKRFEPFSGSWNFLSSLGVTVVLCDGDHVHPSLSIILKELPHFRLKNVLAGLESTGSLSDRFCNVDADQHKAFASWVRVSYIKEYEHFNLMQQLPIWPTRQRNIEKLRSISEQFLMLPEGVPVDMAARFMNESVTSHAAQLLQLGVHALSFSALCSRLVLPSVLQAAGDYESYRQLFGKIVSHSRTDSNPLPVPNGYKVIVQSNTLYSSQDQLFVAAFGSSIQHFLAEDFKRFESDLDIHGLRRQRNLSFGIFKDCVLAFQSDQSHDKGVRASEIFRFYCEELPLLIERGQNPWQQLDTIRFIPRSQFEVFRRPKTSQIGCDVTSHLKEFPELVSPNEVVLEEFEPIAWTQQALIDQPHERLMMSHRSFGQPTVLEVIQHLRVLTLTVARKYTADRHILSDIKATYTWLNEHTEEAAEHLILYHNEAIFLNVHNPLPLGHDHWAWHSADQLYFEKYDIDDSAYHVRNFLLPYKKLLLVAGAQDVVKPKLPQPHQTSSEEIQLDTLRSQFDSMRKSGMLTDVVFVPYAIEKPTKSDGLPAHRAFLSAFCEHFRNAFCGGYGEGIVQGEPGDPVLFKVWTSMQSVEHVLDYIYTGNINIQDEMEVDDALAVLELSDSWEVTDLFEKIQRIIVEKDMINPQTLEEIAEKARTHNAKSLLDTCEDYALKNVEYIRRINGI
ncbi:hypothetical protein BDQ12DRAFT_267709 [Crucibulum laeve]|uniref:BTB domain-containing protein n=1 Tax=Crucibulum laeve TaxID=68775 RepID=A0A5C3M474_9AGAR|nr:hypothetical protein BDQ12DRAFT_267709 [Crucibulum laeve]